MNYSLNNLHPKKGSKAKKKRVGRGWSSNGKYSGRGVKGQKARSGASGSKKRGLRPLMLATPKVRGFKSPNPDVETVNVGILGKHFAEGATVNPKNLISKGLISTTRHGVKILGGGKLGKKLTIKSCSVSKSAQEKIEAAGGTVVLS